MGIVIDDRAIEDYLGRIGDQVIKEIAALGHEIGYHYEELTTHKGNVSQALGAFKENLEKLRELGIA